MNNKLQKYRSSKKPNCNWVDGVCERGRILIQFGDMPPDGYYGCCGCPETVLHPQLGISMPKDPYAKKCEFLGESGCTVDYEPCKKWFCDLWG